MKIIDLLNKIANGEEVPKKIKYINSIWEYDKITKDYINDNLWLFYSMNSIGLTERKVEIIEESNKIEHIGKIYDITDFKNDYSEAAKLLKDIANKQCEIIDKLNEMSDKK